MNRIESLSTVSVMSLLLLSPAVAAAGVQSCAGLAPTFPSNYSEQASDPYARIGS